MPRVKAAPQRSNNNATNSAKAATARAREQHELVIISGMSGAGKASALKTFEDLGYYCVDNLPVGLIGNFAELVLDTLEIQRAALVVDIREGARLDKLPQILATLRRLLKTTVLFLEADEEALLRRYSETRRPHPLGRNVSVRASLSAERRRLKPLRALADFVIDTTKFNVHELRTQLTERFTEGKSEKNILISCVSFGYREGVPEDADLVFDVRFLPNPHFIPK
ncbi:MAG: RNase adapter RapZ, partial [Candidatus Korobacteraceae bacterium]